MASRAWIEASSRLTGLYAREAVPSYGPRPEAQEMRNQTSPSVVHGYA